MYRSYSANSRKGVRDSDGEFTDRMNLGADLTRIYTSGGRDILRGTFANGKPQSEYTSKVVELKVPSSETSIPLRWAPVLRGTILLDDGTNYIVDDGEGHLVKHVQADVTIEKVATDDGKIMYKFYKISDGTLDAGSSFTGSVSYGTTRDVHGNDTNVDNVAGYAGAITGVTLTAATEVSYQYENEYVPQNDIPLIGMKMERIPVFTKARRIAVYFSQLADFEAQKDYGYNLGEDLRQQAEFQLQYEIDCEVLENIKAIGEANGTPIKWYTKPGVGVNLRDHFETLQVKIAEANARLFSVTQKFHGNYLLVGPSGLRFFSMMNGFKMLTGTKFGYGPYVAGELGGVKVICTPTITGDDMYLGVNTPEASAVLFGTYMPILPTQLLQFADGGTSQGWSTLYDVVRLNDNLVVKIEVLDAMDPAVLIQAAATPSADQTFTDANGVTWTVAAGE